MPTFDKPSDALATLPKDAKFIVRQCGTGGRPLEILKADGESAWDRESFLKAQADGEIPRERLMLRTLDGTKLSKQKITLDLSMSNEQTTVESGRPPLAEFENQQLQVTYLQESVVTALVENMRDGKEEIQSLREEVSERDDEIVALKLRVAELEHEVSSNAANDSIGVMFSKMFQEFVKGPGGAIMASKLLSGKEGGDLLTQALKNAAPTG